MHATTTWDDQALAAAARALGERLQARGWRLATAESCTGGWLAKVVTDIAGSSAWFDRGFVTYANAAKVAMLAVPSALLERHGAVSEPVAEAMVRGALAHSDARVAVAITGVAGPGGGTPDKPVGMVCFAWLVGGGACHLRTEYFSGDREAIRRQAVARALEGLRHVVTD